MNLLTVSQVTLVKKEDSILKEVSFTVDTGDVMGVVGPSGAGKSSLFRLLNGLQSPSQGQIRYADKLVGEYAPAELRRQIGYILQKPYLFGAKVGENLAYPYQLEHKAVNWQEIEQYLTKVNLASSTLQKKPTELSGGEQQRVALIRSMLIKPRVILLDEVTAALDEENTRIIEDFVLAEQRQRQLTVLFISHNAAQLKRLARTVLYLQAGRVEFAGSIEDFYIWKGDQSDE